MSGRLGGLKPEQRGEATVYEVAPAPRVACTTGPKVAGVNSGIADPRRP